MSKCVILALVELVTHIMQKYGFGVMHTMLKNYILELQAGFKIQSDFDINIVFKKMFSNFFNSGFSVTNNEIRSLQGNSKISSGHYILGEKKIFELNMSDARSESHPNSQVSRVIFSIALACAFKPSELHTLKKSQVGSVEIDGKEVF